MGIPDWLFKLGSLAGLMTFGVGLWDRIFSGGPLVGWSLAD